MGRGGREMVKNRGVWVGEGIVKDGVRREGFRRRGLVKGKWWVGKAYWG